MVQARRQDLAAGGARFKNTVLDVVVTGGPNVKWGPPLPPRWRRSWDDTVSYREFIPSPSYVPSKRTCSLASRALNTGK